MNIPLQKPNLQNTSVGAGLTLMLYSVMFYGQAYLQTAFSHTEVLMLSSFSRILSEPKPITFITFGLLLIILQQVYAWKTK